MYELHVFGTILNLKFKHTFYTVTVYAIHYMFQCWNIIFWWLIYRQKLFLIPPGYIL